MLREEEKKSAVTHLSDDEGYLQELTEEDRAKLASVEERIKKLLAVGKDDRNISTQEMDAAMNLAVKLARQNGLDLYRLEREMHKGGAEFVVRVLELGGHANWRVQLVGVIARALICRMLTHSISKAATKPNARTGRVIRHPRADYVSLVGMPQDIELVDYLYEYIVRELDKQAKKIFVEDQQAAALIGVKLSGKAFRDEFFRGAVLALDGRLRAMFSKDEQQDDEYPEGDDGLDTDTRPEDERVNPNAALIPLKEADVEKAMNDAFPKLGKGRDIYSKNSASVTVRTRQGFMAGHKAGKELEIRKALNERTGAGALTAGE